MTTNVPALAGNTGTALATAAVHNPFLAAAEDMGASSGALYLKFDGNTGLYSYGKDAEGLPKGTQVALNGTELKRGWICWSGGKVLDEKMIRITDGAPPHSSTLPDLGPYEGGEKDGWKEQTGAQFRDIETGDEFLFKSSSKGGNIALANLIQAYGKSFLMHPGELAIVTLDAVSFDAKDPNTGKKLGKKYAPFFKITGWEDEGALIARFEGMAADEDEAEAEDDIPLAVAEPEPPRRGRNRAY